MENWVQRWEGSVWLLDIWLGDRKYGVVRGNSVCLLDIWLGDRKYGVEVGNGV